MENAEFFKKGTVCMRGARGNYNRREPALPKVQRVELSEKHIKLRIILIVVFLIVGIVALAIFVSSLLRKEAGWREIEPAETLPALQETFVFSYELGTSDTATAEYRVLSTLYAQLGSEYWALFDRYAEYEEIVNLYEINRTPNQTLTVSPVLYAAMQQITAEGARYLYLAPVLDEYASLMLCENDVHASARDPYRSEEAAAYISSLMRYCGDEQSISLELLGDNQICLHVSEEYLQFAAEQELDALIDFGWFKNAFIIDALADAFASAGYVKGNLVSVDGYTRNFDTTHRTPYVYHYFDRQGNAICKAADLAYTGDIAIVDLRAFPIREADAYRTYIYADGSTVTQYVDPADGYYRYAANGLLAYSDTNSCAEIALSIAPIYLANVLNTKALDALLDRDIATIITTDCVIRNNGTDMAPMEGSLYQNETLHYTHEAVIH